MDDMVVVVDVFVCLSFVLRGRHDYGCGSGLGWTWLA